MTRRVRWALGALVLAAALGACTDSDDQTLSAGSDQVATTTTESTVAPTTTTSTTAPPVAVTVPAVLQALASAPPGADLKQFLQCGENALIASDVVDFEPGLSDHAPVDGHATPEGALHDELTPKYADRLPQYVKVYAHENGALFARVVNGEIWAIRSVGHFGPNWFVTGGVACGDGR